MTEIEEYQPRRPMECHRHVREELFNAIQICQMCILDIEST